VVAWVLLLGCGLARAEDGKPAGSGSPIAAAWAEASKSLVPGPATIQLKDQAELNLPEHYAFMPAAAAATLMARMGNSTGENFLGLVVPTGDTKADFFVPAIDEPRRWR
jgi:uncharacterized membrane-anchored protein